MPSPFTPIADYAFLSNCHTGALVAPTAASAGSASRASLPSWESSSGRAT
jgi:hypothetical protein